MSFTVPNLLSLSRMAVVPLFVIALVDGRPYRALMLFAVAGITDLLDGFIARFFNQQSALGRYLDPAADKLLLVVSYIVLAYPGIVRGGIPIWVTTLVITRDVIIVVVALVLYLAHGISRFEPTWISKVNTAVQVSGVVIVLLYAVSERFEMAALVAVHVVAVLTLASGLDYVYRANLMVAEAKKHVAP